FARAGAGAPVEVDVVDEDVGLGERPAFGRGVVCVYEVGRPGDPGRVAELAPLRAQRVHGAAAIAGARWRRGRSERVEAHVGARHLPDLRAVAHGGTPERVVKATRRPRVDLVADR